MNTVDHLFDVFSEATNEVKPRTAEEMFNKSRLPRFESKAIV